MATLVSRTLGVTEAFNWTWFIELCVSGILVLFFCFYFNRLFATIVSYFLRLYTWQTFRIWIDIQAIQISLLGGRLFFKGVRYHGENETILIQSGHITWRYWLKSAKQVDLTNWETDKLENSNRLRNPEPGESGSGSGSQQRDAELGRVQKASKSEARIAVFVNGVEWFIYNRTPLYDAIVRDGDRKDEGSASDLTDQTSEKAEPLDGSQKLRNLLRRRQVYSVTSSNDFRCEDPTITEKHPGEVHSVHSGKSTQSVLQSGTEVSIFQTLLIRALPVYIECSHAAVSMGNEHTRGLLVTTVEKAYGHVDANGCGSNDMYRQLFDFEIVRPIVQMRPNPDFRKQQIPSAENIINDAVEARGKRPWWKPNFEWRRKRYDAFYRLRKVIPWSHASVESLQHGQVRKLSPMGHDAFHDNYHNDKQWHGLGRYLDERETDDHEAWSDIEYGRFSTIMDCPAVHLVFFWDVPGLVCISHQSPTRDASAADINGIAPPEYGLDLTIKGGTINYGPWTDRLRAEIQSMFLPTSYRSATPATPLPVGTWRQSTKMVIRIDIEDDVSLRVPTRERSKDWQWRGRATAVRDAAALRKQRERRHSRFRRGQTSTLGPDIRPFGWLVFSVASDSTVRYEMDMVAGPNGYHNKLFLDLKDTKASSSVNHALLWRCASQKLECDLSNPLSWNGLHTWSFNIINKSMEFFLLRDHMFLLTDLISDFTAGQKSEYMTFVPFKYLLELQFDDLRLYLNANDFNIIDDPCDTDNNAFLILGIHTLKGNVGIPLEYFSSPRNSVNFEAHGDNLYLNLKTPVWNTVRQFSTHEVMATLDDLDLDGAYNYNTATSPQLTDSLIMNIVGRKPKFYLEGFLIRYFMNVKENYFGDHLHYRTLEEYQLASGDDQRPVTQHQNSQAKKDNELDVVLSVRAEESCALMTANIFERSDSLRIDVMNIEADMRFTNYYMDLQVNSSPVEVATETATKDDEAQEAGTSHCQLYIDGMSVFGHRLFGAPPTEPTYICNWDFDLGSILGECSSEFLRIALAAVQSFIFTLDDDENALKTSEVEKLHDVTFLRARTVGTRVWLVNNDTAFLVEIAPFELTLNDWADRLFSRHIRLFIPKIMLAAIDLQFVHRQVDKNTRTASPIACIDTSLRVVTLDRNGDFEKDRTLQQSHVWFHDLRTQRSDHLLHTFTTIKQSEDDTSWSDAVPNIPTPALPRPVTPNFQKQGSMADATATWPIQKTHSLLSMSSGRSSNAIREFTQRNKAESHTSQVVESVSASSIRTLPQPSVAGKFSSAWIPPYFSLHGIEIDKHNMPDQGSTKQPGTDRASFSEPATEIAPQDLSLAHGSVIVILPNGLQAFCVPDLCAHLIHLINTLMPHNPADVMDTIQRDTVANIKQLKFQHLAKISDIAIHIPVIALKAIDQAPQSSTQASSGDSYEVQISDSQFVLRNAPTVVKHSQGRSRGDVLLAQASIKMVYLSISEQSQSRFDETAHLNASLQNISSWLSLQDETRTDFQIGTVEVKTNSSTVDRLSSLFQRSSLMVDKITQSFGNLDQNSEAHHIIYQLAVFDNDKADPAFLSKLSYVLRSSEDHVRFNDSWKAIVMLRQRLNSYLAKASNGSNGIEKRFDFSNFDHKQVIRSFDMQPVNAMRHEVYQPLLKALGRNTTKISSAPGQVGKIVFTALVGYASVILDPGPTQSTISIENGDFVLSQTPVFVETKEDNQPNVQQKSRIVIQSWLSRLFIDLNWELVELAQSIITRLVGPDKKEAEHLLPGSQKASSAKVGNLDLSVVIGIDQALLRLKTINLIFSFSSESLKSSVAINHTQQVASLSILLASETSQANVASNGQTLLAFKIHSPNAYFAHRHDIEHLEQPDTIHVTAICTKLRFKLGTDPLRLLNVAELVMRDELAAIRKMAALLEYDSLPPQSNNESTSLILPDVHVALFLNDYKLRLGLLPTIEYVVAGKVARTSIIPDRDRCLTIRIDVKRHSHTLLRPSSKSTKALSVVEVPPISGRIRLIASDDTLTIKARSVVEKINIEATAVQACLDATYQPQNAEYVKDVKTALNGLQNSFQQQSSFVKLKQKSLQVRKNDYTISYTTHFVLAGFSLHCTTPLSSGQGTSADLRLSIDHTSIRIYNFDARQNLHSNTLQFVFNAPLIVLTLDRKTQSHRYNVGLFKTGFSLAGKTQLDEKGTEIQTYRALSNATVIDLFTETPAVAIDAAAYIQERIKVITAKVEDTKTKPLHRLKAAHSEWRMKKQQTEKNAEGMEDSMSSILLDSVFSLEFNALQARWIIDEATPISPNRKIEDMVFSIRKIDLAAERESSARLSILDLQLQLVPKEQENPSERTLNSALMPEVVFKAAHRSSKSDRRFAFQAAGKALDLKLTSDGMLPVSAIQKSLAKVRSELLRIRNREAEDSVKSQPDSVSGLLGNKRLTSLLVDADFAGAKLSVTPRSEHTQSTAFGFLKGPKRSRAGRYTEIGHLNGADAAVLRAPGVALKVEYLDTGKVDPTLSTEIKVAASKNTLSPSVVPLVLEMYSSVKEILGEAEISTSRNDIKAPAQKYLSETANKETDPTAVLGSIKLNASLWVQRQEFSLTCQPIARVQATALFDDIFVTLNTVQDDVQDRFFSVMTKFNNLRASVQHVYSRESTASFEIESVVMSLMNSRHISTKNGISAILTISPVTTDINARQLQDFLLFREIWYPHELRQTSKPNTPAPSTSNDAQTYAMQRYQELTATAALPWHAVVSIQELRLQIDFGQALGKSSFAISKLWASSKKSSDWEQNLCVGFERVGIDSTGRMSGFVELRNFQGRTSIKWPSSDSLDAHAPLVQASIGFDHLRAKAAFDYQPFAVADVSSFKFLMYNVRSEGEQKQDRLVGILDGGKVQAFCTSAAGGQSIAIIQAFQKLFQEKRDDYQKSLHDSEVERLLRRKSVFTSGANIDSSSELVPNTPTAKKSNHVLHTDVVVTLQAVDIGVFPSTFFDKQILKIEAENAQARFAVATVEGKVRSGLGMSLGQVRVALSAVGRSNTKALDKVEISEVISRATSSRGGTILKVPRLVASMQTWQGEDSNLIEYIFRSTFQGKVDVGWNYSRISFIRGMWETYSEALAQRLGKPLPPAAVKITTDPATEGSGQEKITAVVNMPQSTKYEYVALEPPIIDTPQLRDMGEATPPLEWIGLHRDKLPNVTHSIIITTLLEVAKEVEDAYTKILGTG